MRTPWQAFGFYLAYFLLMLVVAEIVAFACAIVFGVSDANAYSYGLGVGAIIASVGSTYIAFLILKYKGSLKDFSSILYMVATLALGLFGGALLGMIIPAYLSTRKGQH